jgi:hypothetical protein
VRALARLEDFVVVTWAVDPAAMVALLPAGVRLQAPLVSAVAYRYRDLRLAGLPWPRLDCGQIHLRTYVEVGGEQGVWFLDTVQDSRWASLPRRLWGMPWRRGPVEVARDGSEVVTRADGIELTLAPSPTAAAPAAPTLDPMVGWFGGRRGVRRFSVAYGPEAPVFGVVSGRVDRLHDLGLVPVGEAPIHGFGRTRVDIEVSLPPTLAT